MRLERDIGTCHLSVDATHLFSALWEWPHPTSASPVPCASSGLWPLCALAPTASYCTHTNHTQHTYINECFPSNNTDTKQTAQLICAYLFVHSNSSSPIIRIYSFGLRHTHGSPCAVVVLGVCPAPAAPPRRVATAALAAACDGAGVVVVSNRSSVHCAMRASRLCDG